MPLHGPTPGANHRLPVPLTHRGVFWVRCRRHWDQQAISTFFADFAHISVALRLLDGTHDRATLPKSQFRHATLTVHILIEAEPWRSGGTKATTTGRGGVGEA